MRVLVSCVCMCVCVWSGGAVRVRTYKHWVRTWCVKEDGGPRKATSGFLADMSVAILTRS